MLRGIKLVCIESFDPDTLFFVYQLQEKGTNVFPISDTQYVYSECGIKTPDLPI